MPDSILFKTGKLTAEEYALIERHPVIGSEILRGVDFLAEAVQVVRQPPRALGRSRLPGRPARRGDPALGARVRGRRRARRAHHGPPVSPRGRLPEARAEIARGSGTQFDPSVVAAYDTLPDEEFARLRDGVG